MSAVTARLLDLILASVARLPPGYEITRDPCWDKDGWMSSTLDDAVTGRWRRPMPRRASPQYLFLCEAVVLAEEPMSPRPWMAANLAAGEGGPSIAEFRERAARILGVSEAEIEALQAGIQYDRDEAAQYSGLAPLLDLPAYEIGRQVRQYLGARTVGQ